MCVETGFSEQLELFSKKNLFIGSVVCVPTIMPSHNRERYEFNRCS